MRRLSVLLAVILLLSLGASAGALADSPFDMDDTNDGDVDVIIYNESGEELTRRGGAVYVGDEIIMSDNRLFSVISSDGDRAVARYMGYEPEVDYYVAREVFAAAEGEDKDKVIGIYCTHSDESYVPSDGTSSKHENAGIYDVAGSLKEELEKLGIDVKLDETTHHPHDAKAYSRSRSTAEELIKQGADALIDVHRDAIPVSHYETEVDGEEVSKVRLLVGRSNPNASANREFAKQIKAVADKEYPGLIKDIFIGKGNYNQELLPQSILLEFGTHELDKDRAIKSTGMIANVINEVVYSDSASASSAKGTEDNKAGATGIIWVVVIAALATGIYALISTGTFKRMMNKLGRATSEITGGSIGKGPEDEDKDE